MVYYLYLIFLAINHNSVIQSITQRALLFIYGHLESAVSSDRVG